MVSIPRLPISWRLLLKKIICGLRSVWLPTPLMSALAVFALRVLRILSTLRLSACITSPVSLRPMLNVWKMYWGLVLLSLTRASLGRMTLSPCIVMISLPILLLTLMCDVMLRNSVWLIGWLRTLSKSRSLALLHKKRTFAAGPICVKVVKLLTQLTSRRTIKLVQERKELKWPTCSSRPAATTTPQATPTCRAWATPSSATPTARSRTGGRAGSSSRTFARGWIPSPSFFPRELDKVNKCGRLYLCKFCDESCFWESYLLPLQGREGGMPLWKVNQG